MVWWLALFLLLTAVYLVTAQLNKNTRGDLDRVLAVGYNASVAAVLTGLLVGHTGCADKALRERTTRMEFRGVAVNVRSLSSHAAVRLTGHPITANSPFKQAFRWYALPSDGVIDIRPAAVSGSTIRSYLAVVRNVSRPVRLNGVSINQPLGGWIRTHGYFAFGEGSSAVSFTMRRLGESVELEASTGERGSSRLLRHQPLTDFLVAAHLPKLLSNLQALHGPDGNDMLRRAYLIRRVERSADSEIGMLIAGPPPIVTSASEAPQPSPIEAHQERYLLEIVIEGGREAINLPSEAVPTMSGFRLDFRFDPCRSYPLPPEDVLTKQKGIVEISSGDGGMAFDGYVFDTGNLNEPFMARARVLPGQAGLAFVSQTGKAAERLLVNQEKVFADDGIAPIFALADPVRSSDKVWVWPIVALWVGALAALSWCVVGRGVRRIRRLSRANLLLVLWAGAAALLCVQAVLAYRVSMLPPFNMGSDAAAVYRECWPVAEWAMIIFFPLFGLVCGIAIVFLERRTRKTPLDPLFERVTATGGLRGTASVLGLLALAIATVVLLSKFVRIDRVGPSYLQFAVLLFGLAFLANGVSKDREMPARPSAESASRWSRIWSFLGARSTFIGGIAGIAIFVADLGYFVFAVPFLIAYFVRGIRPEETMPWRRLGLLPFMLAVVAITPFALGPLSSGGKALASLPNRFQAKAFSSALPYRLAVARPDTGYDLLLADASPESGMRPDTLLNTFYQRWQMLSYVQGSGAGYFGAPLTKVGMTYPTMLSDASFSVFVVGEHGKLAGWLLVGLELLIGLVLFFAARDAARSTKRRENVLALYFFAGAIAFVSVYMALGNLWAVPFTGQNMPLLSLGSRTNVVLYCGLLIAAAFLIGYPPDEQERQIKERSQKGWGWWWGFPVVLGGGWLLLGVELARLGGPPRDFNFPPRAYDQLERKVKAAKQEMSAAELAATRLSSTTVISMSSRFIANAVEAFDNGSISGTPFRQRRSGSSVIEVDRRHYMRSSPYSKDEGASWRGGIYAVNPSSRHEVLVAGSPEPVVLNRRGGSPTLIAGQPFSATEAKRIDFRHIHSYGGIELLADDTVLLTWNDYHKPGQILVNGTSLDMGPQQKYVVQPLDLITLKVREQDGRTSRAAIRYLGRWSELVGRVSWRNGSYVRTFPMRADFPLAYSIGEVGDDLSRNKPSKDDLHLSLDIGLQRSMQRELRMWGQSELRALDRGRKSSDGLPFTAVTVLDTFTGQIRALSAIPQCDPGDDFRLVMERFASETEATYAARSSWNFAARTIGSTTKPLSFAALASGVNHAGFDLASLHVSEVAGVRNNSFKQLGDLSLRRGLAVNVRPRADVSMPEYLRDSRTWPAVVTATLGLVQNGNQLASLLGSSRARGYVWSANNHYSFTPAATLERDFNSLKDLTISSQAIDRSAYMQGLISCYGPNIVPSYQNERFLKAPEISSKFLSPLDVEECRDLSLKTFALPDVHWADSTRMTDFELQLVRYMIGGGEARWSAVMMATNFARIITGRKVQPTLAAQVQPDLGDMPRPISDVAWRRRNLLEPLLNITTLPGGTSLRARLASMGVRVAMKTGTIDDGTGQESEMLMFTLGRFANGEFVRGKSVTGFVSIRSAKRARGDEMIKDELAGRILPILARYVQQIQ